MLVYSSRVLQGRTIAHEFNEEVGRSQHNNNESMRGRLEQNIISGDESKLMKCLAIRRPGFSDFKRIGPS